MTFWRDPTEGVGRDSFGDSSRRALDSLAKFLRRTPPVGTVHVFAGLAASLPTGYLLCYGQEIAVGSYNDLFTVLGTAWNTGGEAAGNFRVPDFRGRVPVGLDNMGGSDAGRLNVANTLGLTGGEQLHTLTVPELAAHTHPPLTNSNFIGNGAPFVVDTSTGSAIGTDATTGSTGSSTPFNVMQPYALVNYIIRY